METKSNMPNLAKAIGDIASEEIDERMYGVVADLESRMADIAAKVTGQVREIVVSAPSREAVNVGRQHERFESLLRCVMSETPVWLAGPAGSGKTVAAEKCALAPGLAFSSVSIGPQ